MSSKVNVQALIAKVLSDDKFAEALVSDPTATLKAAGIEATPQILKALKGVDVAAMRKLAQAFGGDKAAL